MKTRPRDTLHNIVKRWPIIYYIYIYTSSRRFTTLNGALFPVGRQLFHPFLLPSRAQTFGHSRFSFYSCHYCAYRGNQLTMNVDNTSVRSDEKNTLIANLQSLLPFTKYSHFAYYLNNKKWNKRFLFSFTGEQGSASIRLYIYIYLLINGQCCFTHVNVFRISYNKKHFYDKNNFPV